MAARKGELEQKDEAYARAHDDLYAVYLLRFLLGFLPVAYAVVGTRRHARWRMT
jgi:hypothetical protein